MILRIVSIEWERAMNYFNAITQGVSDYWTNRPVTSIINDGVTIVTACEVVRRLLKKDQSIADQEIFDNLLRNKCPATKKERANYIGAMTRAQDNVITRRALEIFDKCPLI